MSLREQFEALDYATVEKYIDVQEENLHLEFKLVDADPFKKANDRKNLAKVLAGFANSDGGICIWGVDARENADRIDVACKIVPSSNAKLLLSRLSDLASGAANPAVDGVLHKVLPSGVSEGGIAATFVPASDSGPTWLSSGKIATSSGAAAVFSRWNILTLKICSAAALARFFSGHTKSRRRALAQPDRRSYSNSTSSSQSKTRPRCGGGPVAGDSR